MIPFCRLTCLLLVIGWACTAIRLEAHSPDVEIASTEVPQSSGQTAAPHAPHDLEVGHPAPAALSPATALSELAVVAANNKAEQQVRSIAGSDPDAVALVVVVCKRPQYLQRTMTSVLKTKRNPLKWPILISQDEHDETMTQLVGSRYVLPGFAFHMHHEHDPKIESWGHARVAEHYGFIMKKVFDDFGFNQVAFVEEDMEIAPDFFSYFGSMLPMIKAPESEVICVSAWNDNGEASLVSDPKALYRTDVFPGLGWMMHKNFWSEVRDRWPDNYWDEFMRRGDVRKGRHCIRPEISRTFTFGAQGVSGGMFYEQYLSKIKLNDVDVDWGHENISYLETPAAFDNHLAEKLRAAKEVDFQSLDSRLQDTSTAARIVYDDKSQYQAIARRFNLMEDEKDGLRRTSFRGVIPFAWHGRRIYLYTNAWPGNLN